MLPEYFTASIEYTWSVLFINFPKLTNPRIIFRAKFKYDVPRMRSAVGNRSPSVSHAFDDDGEPASATRQWFIIPNKRRLHNTTNRKFTYETIRFSLRNKDATTARARLVCRVPDLVQGSEVA